MMDLLAISFNLTSNGVLIYYYFICNCMTVPSTCRHRPPASCLDWDNLQRNCQFGLGLAQDIKSDSKWTVLLFANDCQKNKNMKNDRWASRLNGNHIAIHCTIDGLAAIQQYQRFSVNYWYLTRLRLLSMRVQLSHNIALKVDFASWWWNSWNSNANRSHDFNNHDINNYTYDINSMSTIFITCMMWLLAVESLGSLGPRCQ